MRGLSRGGPGVNPRRARERLVEIISRPPTLETVYLS